MDLPILVILAVVCVAIGFALDNLLHSLRGEKAAEPAAQPGSAASTLEDAEALRRAKTARPWPKESVRTPLETENVPPSSSKPVLEEGFRIWRGPVEKDLIVEVSGKQAHAPSDLDRDQLDRLGAALQELSAWLGRGVSASAPVPPSSLPAGLLEAVPGLGEVEPAGESGTAEVRRPSLNPIDVVSNALRAEIRNPPRPADKSLAAQVDAVLQEKLKGTPLEKRGIRLTDAADGGLLVQVGIDKYAGVEEVPDMEIQEIIRSAVAEWGKRTSPGK